MRHAHSKVDQAFRRPGAPQFSGFSGSGISLTLSPHPGSSVAAAQSKLGDLRADMANRGTAMSDGWGAAPSRSVETPTKGQQGKGGKGTGAHRGGRGGGGGGSGGGTHTFLNRALKSTKFMNGKKVQTQQTKAAKAAAAAAPWRNS